MNNLELLKMLSDIDEKFLTEEYQPTKRYRKSIKERMSEMKNVKLKYVFAPIMTLTIVLVSIVAINNINYKPELKIAKDTEIVKENNKENNIIFNTGFEEIAQADFDAEWKDGNIIEEFNYIKNIDILKKYDNLREGMVYVKENPLNANYTKLHQYELIYYMDNNTSSYIEIICTKEDKILKCILPEKDSFKNSVINNNEVALFKTENYEDKSKINGIASFEYNDYKFFIEANGINENELVDLIKGIIE